VIRKAIKTDTGLLPDSDSTSTTAGYTQIFRKLDTSIIISKISSLWKQVEQINYLINLGVDSKSMSHAKLPKCCN